MKAEVVVKLKPSVLDPQGETIRAALERLGLDKTSRVRVGKLFEIEFSEETPAEIRRQVDEACRKLLANPVVETYEIHVKED